MRKKNRIKKMKRVNERKRTLYEEARDRAFDNWAEHQYQLRCQKDNKLDRDGLPINWRKVVAKVMSW
jgi:hypothetical protein